MINKFVKTRLVFALLYTKTHQLTFVQ